VIIRAETPGDRSAIRDVVVEAFTGTQEADLIEGLRRDGALAISLVAEMDGRICGHVALSRLKSPSCALALAPLAVASVRQRQGIGSTLVRSAIDAAKLDRAEMIFVLGEPGYYGRFGFTIEAAAPLPSPYAGPHFMALKLFSRADPIGPVVYADAFDALR
jgi:putative acetyltransferase